MKLILTVVTLFILSSCGQNAQQEKTVTIDPNTIQQGEIVHDSLNPDQLQKITKIQSTFADVYPVSLGETIADFKKDQNVDAEIDTWLQMVSAYENYLKSRKDTPDLNTRKEVFALVLLRSTMSSEEALSNVQLKFLSKEESEKVLSYYTSKPEPIKVIQK